MEMRLFDDDGKEIAVWEVSGHQECFELATLDKSETLTVVFTAIRPKENLDGHRR